jgi:hypothetical protein
MYDVISIAERRVEYAQAARLVTSQVCPVEGSSCTILYCMLGRAYFSGGVICSDRHTPLPYG